MPLTDLPLLLLLVAHGLSFVAPAAFMAVLLVVAGKLLMRKGKAWVNPWVQMAINSGVGVAVLWLGLWFFGNDGKLATYAALVVCCASSQWAMLKAWQRN